MLAGLAEQGRSDALVVGGGVIPPNDEATILEWGVAAIFGPGTNAGDAIEMIRERLTPVSP